MLALSLNLFCNSCNKGGHVPCNQKQKSPHCKDSIKICLLLKLIEEIKRNYKIEREIRQIRKVLIKKPFASYKGLCKPLRRK